MIGWSLSAVVVISLLAIGVGAFVAPGRASAQYGIVLADPRAHAFIRAMGARDFVIGGLLALMALERAWTMLAWGMYLAAVIALVDLVVVSGDRRLAQPGASGAVESARALHAGGIVGLLITGTALLAGW